MGYSLKIKRLYDLDLISREFEKLSKQFSVFNSPLAMITQNTWRPPTDVYETSEKIVIKMEIAGIKIENLDIKLLGRTLIITGERHDDSQDTKLQYKLMEINYGYFEKMILLPEDLDFENISGVYNNGFIEIAIPKKNKNELFIDINFLEEDNKNI